MTYQCPCGNTVIIDGPYRTGFPFGPPEVKLAYHYSCAEKLGVPRPPNKEQRLLLLLAETNKKLIETKGMLAIGNFKNGVTDSSNTIDEGEVMAGRFFEELDQLIKKIEKEIK